MTDPASESATISSSMFSSCEFSESIAATTSFFSSSTPSSLALGSTDSAADAQEMANPLMLFSVSGTRLTIRDGNSLEVLRSYNCVDKIDRISLSPDKKYILCAMYAREIVEMFSLSDSEWRCKITEGVGAGLISADWTPDSRHVISQSDFGIQLRIWSLSDSSSVIISSPKHLAASDMLTSGAMQQSYAFSECGLYLAVLHRIELQDYIGIYSTNPWEELAKFRCQTSDACHIQWLPKGLHVIVADSPLQYKVVIYSPSGQVRFPMIRLLVT
jgi:WD40 repeat protein